MQIKVFTIPVLHGEVQEDEMNRFLRGHRILDIRSEFLAITASSTMAYWSFCVRYLVGNTPETGSPIKKDYKAILDAATFERFDKLRTIRKTLAKEDAVPAYAVFIDEELANMAGLETLTLKSIQSIKGIGEKRVEKYGNKLLALWGKSTEDHEASR